MVTNRGWRVAVLSGAVLFTAGSAWAEEMAPAAAPAEQTSHKEQPAAEGDKKDAKQAHRAQRREERRKRIHESLFKDITLTEDQQAKVKQVMDKGRAEREAWMQEKGEELRKIRTAMREAREAGDEEGTRDARESLQALMKDAPRPERYYDQVKALLTEEQAAQFATNSEELRQRWRERGKKRGPDGPDAEQKPGGGAPAKGKGDKLDL